MGKKNRNMNSKKKEVAVIITENDEHMEKLLEKSIELIFNLAVEKLVVESKLRLSVAIRIVLSRGRVFGEEKNILCNILKNSRIIIEHDENYNMVPNFENLSKLARFSKECLVNMIVNHESKPTKKDAIMFLLCSDYLSFDDEVKDADDDEFNMEKPEIGAPCLKIDLGEMLKQLPWLDMESLLQKNGLGISSKIEDYIAIVQSEKSGNNLLTIYEGCKGNIVEEKVNLERGMRKRHKDLIREIEKAKVKLGDINEKKEQLYALFLVEERLYRLEKINGKYRFDDHVRYKIDMEAQPYMDELKRLEHQLSQL